MSKLVYVAILVKNYNLLHRGAAYFYANLSLLGKQKPHKCPFLSTVGQDSLSNIVVQLMLLLLDMSIDRNLRQHAL